MKQFAGSGGGSSPKNQRDTYFSDDVIELVLAISEGQIKGLKDGTAKNFYVGGTPLLNSSGMSNFSDFELTVNVGSPLGELIVPTLGGQSVSETVNTELSQYVPVVRQGTQTDIDWLELRLVINQLVRNSEDGARKRDLTIQIEIKPSNETSWTAPVLYADVGTATTEDEHGLNIIHRDDIASATTAARTQKIYNQATEPNPTSYERSLGAVYGRRVWWVNNFQPKFYANSEFFTPDNLTVDATPGKEIAEFDDSNYIALIDPARQDIKRKIYFWEVGTPTDPRMGDLWFKPSDSTLLWFNGAAWVAGLGPEGAYDPTAGVKVIDQAGLLVLRDKITSAAVREVKIKVDRIGVPYDLRVTKLTKDSQDLTEDRTDVSWESFQEITAEPMRFPNLATVHLKGRSSDQFSSLPELTGVYEGRVVKVPSNYDPVERTYAGVWDGTWKLAYTNNPAFIGYDAVENDRYGMSATYPVTVDPFDIYECGVWCDQRLPNGRPQFTFNSLIQDPQSPRELATYIFGIFGGRFFDDGNGYGRVKIDNDAPAVHLFTKENVKSGTFKYSYTETETRVNDYTVSFKNPDLFYAQDRRRVYDQSSIDTFGRVPDDFIAVGCNNADEAVYRANVKLLSGQTEVETVTFETAREGLYLEQYDIILVSDDTMGEDITGRIVGTIGARTIVLRDNIYLEDGFDHEIILNLNQFELATLPIASASVGHTTRIVEVTQDIPAGLPSQAVFTIGQDVKPYRVMVIGENEGDDGDGETVVISAIEVNRTKYAVAAEAPGSVDIPIPEFPTDLSMIQNARITPWSEVRSGRVVQNLRVEWDPHPNKFVRTYSISSRLNDDQWQFNDQVNQPVFNLYDVRQGQYVVSIQGLAMTGQKTVMAYVDIDLSGEVRTVASIKNLALVNETTVSGQLHLFDDVFADLKWEPGELDPALSSYRVDIYSDTEELLRSTFMGVPLFTYTMAMMRLDGATRQLRVEVTAFDFYGNQSQPASILIKNPAPDAPQVAAERGFGSVSFTWPIDSVVDYVGSLVWVSDEPEIDPTSRDADFDLNGNILSVPVESLNAKYCRVALYDTMGRTELNYSQEVYAQSYQTVDSEPPATPVGLQVSSTLVDGKARIVATWGANAEEDLAGYDIDVKQGNGNFVGYSVVTAHFEFDGIPGEIYTVQVRARDKSSNPSPYTTPETHTAAVDTIPPATPTDLTIDPGFELLWLKWSKNTEADFAFYEIFESTTTAEPTATTVATFKTQADQLSRTGLSAGATRYYWIRAVDRSGNKSAWSARVDATAGGLSSADLTGLITDASFGPGPFSVPNFSILDTLGNTMFASDGEISPNAYINVNSNNVLISTVASNAIVPSIHFVGTFASAPTEVTLGDDWRQNAVYKNSTDGKSYVLTGDPLGWVFYLEDGKSFSVAIESTNGTIFRVGHNQTTMLKARVFKNGAEVTDEIPASWFRWRRVSITPQSPPNDDATWNSLYLTGYKQISVSVDQVLARATFFTDIIST
ncbi:phage tail protein [Mesorhizobium sp.]|uniref:phage tail protein n=1 Tax=Mesorhizobium sp. TaxID=1871066 RepID=UPI000FE90DB9|nr:phage tail protein [Mesorhizobium sp.]RWD47479.1 MAG: hypothetical protein EOS35_06450 [Mesorhizobium sp.]